MTLIEQLQQEMMAPHGQARALPFAAFTDPELFALEQRNIFANEWQFLCMEEEIATPGSYLAAQIAGEPIVAIRGEDGELRVFSNLCRHRGTPLLDAGFGQIDKNIVCPYHAWAYTTQGALKAVPFNKEVEVDKPRYGLKPFRLEIWYGLVFVHLGDRPAALRERLSGLDELIAVFEPEKFDRAVPGKSECWRANWKLAVENGIESYHLFKVHQETLEQYTPTRDAYYVAGSSEWVLTGGKMQQEAGLMERLLGAADQGVYGQYLLIFIAPSFIGIMSYGRLDWLCAQPLDVGQTEIRSGSIGQSKWLVDEPGSQSFTDAFYAEDRQICERLQQGMQSQLADAGPLVDMERVLVDFHQFLGSRLFNLPSSPLYEAAKAQWFRDAARQAG